MPLLETLICSVAPAIAKIVVKMWTADDRFASEASTSAVEVLTKLIPEIRARTEADRQLAAIGERAAESLSFIFETEGKNLMVDDQEAVASLVAQTLDHSKITPELLLQKDLDPIRLAQHFLAEANQQLVLFPEQRARLFSRVIEEASQSIIDISRVLPNFSERTFAELLRRDRILINAAQRTLDDLDRIRSQSKDDKKSASVRFETEYRRAVVRNLNKVELFGIDLSRASRSHPLNVAYVSLDVGSSAKLSGEPTHHEQEEEEESVVHNVETALAGNSRMLVRGPAGAGKTTLVHWIAVRAAARDFEHPLEDWNTAIPFVIRLRQFGESSFPRPEEFLSLVAPTIADTMPRGWVHERLSSGRAVVMIDGIDEVAESRRDDARKWVKQLTDTFPASRFIVTSRPHAVHDGWLETENFGESDLQPMDIAGIEQFIDHWHMAVAEEVRREDEIVSLQRLAHNLKATLRGNRAIRRLATNPLLCSVICALHRDTNEQLPEDRLDLYERCCSMLLERRDPESGLRITGYPRLSYRQKRLLLDDLAYWMIKNEWTEISIDSARDRLDKRIGSLRSDASDALPLTSHGVLRLFIERSGILRQPIDGKLDFAHRTFEEFMAANAAIAEGDIGILVANATNPQWREVIVLGAGLARRSERAQLITSLLDKGDRDRAHRHQLHLLAAACLDTSVDIDRELGAEVGSRIEQLVPPKTVSEAILIADAAGEMAVPFLKRTANMNARESAASVRALALIGSLESIQAIAEYADSYGSVLKEVVRAADRIDRSLFLKLIAPRLEPKRLPGDAVAHALHTFGIETMKGLEDAQELTLSGRRAADLSILRRFHSLRSLKLSGPAVTVLTPLMGLTTLERLTLTAVEVSDFSPLQSLRIDSLTVTYTNIDINHLVGISTLKSLSIWNSNISNPISLQRLAGLRYLGLFWPETVDLSALGTMASLTELSLSKVRADLSPMSGLHNLTRLYISFTEIKNIDWLHRLMNLETIELYYDKILDSIDFPTLPKLQKLNVRGSKIGAEIIRDIRRRHPGVRIIT